MHHKIAFCPEDRKIQGIIGDLSVRENIIIGLQAKKGMWNHIPLKEQEQIADEYIKLLQIKVSSPEQLIRNLSGGNQQKAIIAREIDKDPKLLVAVQPTRGLDVGAIEYIHRQIVAERDKGTAVLLVSLELDEVMNLSDRILVMYEGEVVGEFDPKTTTVQELGLYMAGARKQGKESK